LGVKPEKTSICSQMWKGKEQPLADRRKIGLQKSFLKIKQVNSSRKEREYGRTTKKTAEGN